MPERGNVNVEENEDDDFERAEAEVEVDLETDLVESEEEGLGIISEARPPVNLPAASKSKQIVSSSKVNPSIKQLSVNGGNSIGFSEWSLDNRRLPGTGSL